MYILIFRLNLPIFRVTR